MSHATCSHLDLDLSHPASILPPINDSAMCAFVFPCRPNDVLHIVKTYSVCNWSQWCTV